MKRVETLCLPPITNKVISSPFYTLASLFLYQPLTSLGFHPESKLRYTCCSSCIHFCQTVPFTVTHSFTIEAEIRAIFIFKFYPAGCTMTFNCDAPKEWLYQIHIYQNLDMSTLFTPSHCNNHILHVWYYASYLFANFFFQLVNGEVQYLNPHLWPLD